MDFRMELVALPVTDVDRARDFYAGLGWSVDHDHTVSEDVRFVQVTPPGSACSIAFGLSISHAEPGSVEGLYLGVDDAEAARDHLESCGVEVRGIEDFPWGRFCWFTDPDGNGWAVQQLPGRD